MLAARPEGRDGAGAAASAVRTMGKGIRAMRHPLLFPPGVVGGLLRATRLTPDRCYVDVGAVEAEVRLGWMFSTRFPAPAIAGAEPFTGRLQRSQGARVRLVHDGMLAVTTRPEGLVALRLDPPQRMRVLKVPSTVHTVVVSVADPVALIEDVSGAA